VDISTRQSQPRDVDLFLAPDADLDVPAAPVPEAELAPTLPRGRGTLAKPLRLYPFGVSRNRLDQAIASLGVPAVIVRDLREADLVITLKNYFRQKPQPLRDAESRGTPVYVLRSNTGVQMEQVLSGLFPLANRRPGTAPVDGSPEPTSGPRPNDDLVNRALEEAEVAIGAVMDGSAAVSLDPQVAFVRRLQHQLADRFNVASRSRGSEPHRHVEVFR